MNETLTTLLSLLSTGPISGPEMASQLNISRAAIWKYIEQLRDQGFTIESTPEGYTVAEISGYTAPTIRYGLDAPYKIIYFDQIDSTNIRGRQLAEAGRTNTVVVADKQTGGRGRLDRSWESPRGGIWASIIIQPNCPFSYLPMYTLAAAVSISVSLSASGYDATIKWPNDVLIGESKHKVAGILTESAGETDRVSWLVIGMGINANVNPTALPPGSVSLSTKGTVNRRELLQAILEKFHSLTTLGNEETYQRVGETILHEWRAQAATLGQQVRVDTTEATIVGEAVDIQFPGALVVETGTGTKNLHAGDCTHLRSDTP